MANHAEGYANAVLPGPILVLLCVAITSTRLPILTGLAFRHLFLLLRLAPSLLRIHGNRDTRHWDSRNNRHRTFFPAWTHRGRYPLRYRLHRLDSSDCGERNLLQKSEAVDYCPRNTG